MKKLNKGILVFALLLGFGLVSVHAQSSKRSIQVGKTTKSGQVLKQNEASDYKNQPGVSIHEISMPDMTEEKIAHLEAAVANDDSFLAVDVNRKKKSFTLAFAEEAPTEKVSACIMAMVEGRMRQAGREHR